MKRIVLLTLLISALGFSVAAAQTPNPPGNPPAERGTAVGPNFVDADGDGICDYFQNGGRRAGRQAQAGKRGGYGPGDGTGRQGIGPRDGTGYGPGAKSGNCTGTGPQGAQRMRGRARQ